MAWVTIPNQTIWEYDNAPADPGTDSPYYELWAKSSGGIRQFKSGHEVYVKCRRIGTTVDTAGEISKSFWDAKA